MTTDASVYIHIPFCIKKCGYCSFYSTGNASFEVKQLYKEALICQIKSFGDEFGRLPLDTLYIGGGTPPEIGIDALSEIIIAVRDSFSVNGDAEITAEINPASVNEDGIKRLAEIGVNRFSIGLQSFDDNMLKKLGRQHTSEDFFKTYQCCRENSENVSVDLMFALPDQTLDLLKKDVGSVCGLSPDHVSLYCLTLDKNTPLYKNKNDYSFADDDLQSDMYLYICGELLKNGYEHYEISNFAKPGKRSRHNVKCWKRFEYISFGAASHSFYQNRRYSFMPSIAEYSQKGRSMSYSELSGIYDSLPVGDKEAETERIMLGLRMKDGINCKKNIPAFLLNGGFANYENGILSLTDNGMFVSNTIINMLT